MEPQVQAEVVSRLKSVEGHVCGVLHMVEGERSCLAVVQQIRAIQGSLRQVSLLLLKQHVDICLQDVCGEPSDDTHQRLRKELLAIVNQKV